MGPKESTFNGRTVLVFGGCGFIGSNFIRYMLREYPEVNIIVFDKLTYSGNVNNLRDVNHLIKIYANMDVADQGDVDHVFEQEDPDYVINFAAETHVDRSIHVGSKEFIDTNVTGVYNILEAIKKHEGVVIKYVQVSTDEVYGMLPNPLDFEAGSAQRDHAGQMKFHEESPFKPNVPYSATKAAGDCLCNAYFHTWRIPVVVTHCSNNYGPYQYPEKLVPFWATRLLAGLKIPVYGDGLNVRDWIHVDDHIEALVLCLLNGVPGETYNIGADNERSNLEMAQIMVDVVLREFKGVHAPNVEDNLEFVKDRPGHDRRYAIDHSKITRELGWRPKYGAAEFAAKLRETLEWYRDNVEWSREIIKRTGVSNPHIDLWGGVMDTKDLQQ